MKFRVSRFIFKNIVSGVLLLLHLPANSQLIQTIGGNGLSANQGNNIPAICATIASPQGICLDGSGNLYVTCSNSIRKINLGTGIITYVAGSDTWGHTGDGGSAVNATLQFPFDVAMDNNGNLYISEYGGNCVRKINTNTGIISTVAGNFSPGFSGDGGPAINASLNQPWGICTDPSGNIYVADNKNSRVRKININTGVITTFAGNGATMYSGDGSLAINAGIPYPVDVASDTNGNIYIVEVFSSNTSRVRMVNATTGIISTVAGNGIYAYSGDGGPAVNASLFDPSAITIDGLGNLYIADYDQSRIRKVDANTGIINTIAGVGVNSFSGDGGPALSATFHYSWGLAINNYGDLFFSDNFNHRIRRIGNQVLAPSGVNASLNISTSPATICPGTAVSFTASLVNPGTGAAYTWLVNSVELSNTAGIFTTTSLNNGDIVTCRVATTYCNNLLFIQSNQITIQYSSPVSPQISISASNTSICTGQNVTFIAAFQQAGANPSFQWKVNGTNTGSNSNTFITSALSNGDQVSCVITTDPAFSCGSVLTAASIPITIMVSTTNIPSVSITASANDICPNTPVTLTANAFNAGNPVNYTWKVNGTVTGNNSSILNYNNFSNNDIVTCEIVPGPNSCSSMLVSSSITINVKPQPVITLMPRDTLVYIGNTVQLNANVSGNIASFQWVPAASLLNSNTLSPTTIPLNRETEFTLAIIFSDGCRAIAKSIVKIYTKIFMPSAFTPNNDGLNDVFRIPQGAKINLKKFSIYDRWGNKVFSTNDITQGWNGKTGDIQRDSGVYVFYLLASDNNGPIFLKGTFMLIR